MAKLYTPQEVAEMTSLHYRTVLKLIKAGHIKAIRVNRSYRISQSSIDKFMSSGE